MLPIGVCLFVCFFTTKEYVGKVVEHLKENNPDRVDSFKAECKTAVGKVSL